MADNNTNSSGGHNWNVSRRNTHYRNNNNNNQTQSTNRFPNNRRRFNNRKFIGKSKPLLSSVAAAGAAPPSNAVLSGGISKSSRPSLRFNNPQIHRSKRTNNFDKRKGKNGRRFQKRDTATASATTTTTTATSTVPTADSPSKNRTNNRRDRTLSPKAIQLISQSIDTVISSKITFTPTAKEDGSTSMPLTLGEITDLESVSHLISHLALQKAASQNHFLPSPVKHTLPVSNGSLPSFSPPSFTLPSFTLPSNQSSPLPSSFLPPK